MNNLNRIRLSFLVQGHFNQTVVVNGITGDELIAALNSGKALTSVQEAGDVVLSQEGEYKKIGVVESSDSGCEYTDFDKTGDDEQVTAIPFEKCIIAVVNKTTAMIVSYRLVDSEMANDCLLDACAGFVSNWDEHTAEDREAICDDGYYETGSLFISAVHLDEDGSYDQVLS